MNHDYIIKSEVIDQYVLGKLTADQVEEFEAHFVDCPECIDQLDISRSFILDLKGLAVQETLFSNVRHVSKTQRWRPKYSLTTLWPAIACASVIVAVGIGFLAVGRLGRLETELRQAKADAVDLSQKYQQGVETAAESEKQHRETQQALAQRVGELEQKVETERVANKQATQSRGSGAPEVNFPIFALVASARSQIPSPVEITPPAGSSRIALSIPVEENKDFSDYRVTILDRRGVRVFNQAGFKPDAYHALSLSLNANFFTPSTYELKVEGLTQPHQWSLVGTYPFRVITRR